MITTNDIKVHQDNVFSVGSRQPQKEIFILASCRGVPYLNYLNRYNEMNGQPFRITYVSPHEYVSTSAGHPRNLEQELARLETHEPLLERIRACDIFIHEHHANFGMFNTSYSSEKNIYQFGMEPELNIALPNFNNHFMSMQDLVDYEGEIKSRILADLHEVGFITPETVSYVQFRSYHHLMRFKKACELSSFPEFWPYFRDNYKTTRFFWTFNHVSKWFTLDLFRRMNEQFLKLDLRQDFWVEALAEDLFKSPCTPYTTQDRDILGLQWTENFSTLKL